MEKKPFKNSRKIKEIRNKNDNVEYKLIIVRHKLWFIISKILISSY